MAFDENHGFRDYLLSLTIIPLTHAQETCTSLLAQETCTSDMLFCATFLHQRQHNCILHKLVQIVTWTYIKIWHKKPAQVSCPYQNYIN